MVKINYQNILDQELEKIQKNNKKPRLLLHSCCAPCSSYVLEYLSKYFDITCFYYNPNITPQKEFVKRTEELKRLIKQMSLNDIKVIVGDYDNDKYEEEIKGLENEKEGGSRCYKCFLLRLRKTAQLAKDNHFDYFTTSLSISPYKDSSVLNEIGKLLEQEYNISYLYSDFKKKNGYKRSIELSKIYNLYRQDYCGCKYSLKDKEKKV